MSIHHPVTGEAYNRLKNDALENNQLVVVKFGAEWCGPCKKIEPVINKLAKENENVVFIAVDAEEFDDIDDSNDVKGLPTFKFFKRDGDAPECVVAFSGANDEKIKEWVEKLR